MQPDSLHQTRNCVSQACALGGYCARGASLVRSCLEGTFGNVTGLKKPDDCHDCRYVPPAAPTSQPPHHAR